MATRAYTVAELDRMRRCIEVFFGFAPPGNYDWAANGHQWSSRSYNENDRVRMTTAPEGGNV